MNSTLNTRRLETIKALTLAVAGIKIITPMDCRLISISILEKTKLSVSETTIKRVFGFALAKFSPSFFTLNALALYCGFDSLEQFYRSRPDEKLVNNNLTDNSLFTTPLVEVLLETSTPTVVIKTNAPDFTIVTYNKAFQLATNTQKREVIGLTFWEAFNPEKAGGYGPTLLLESFHEAIYTQQTVNMKPLHYNIPSAIANITELNWWDIKIVPVTKYGQTEYLVLNTYNITNKTLNQDAIEEAIMKELTMAEDLATSNVQLINAMATLAETNKELTETKNQLEELNTNLEQRVFERSKKLFESESEQRNLISNAPVGITILKGTEHVIETANKKMIEYWGKGNDVIGKPLAEAIPELNGQPIIPLLNKVRESGIRYENPEFRAFLNFGGVVQTGYYDLIYQPIQHMLSSITDSILIVCVDITEQINARKKVEQSESLLRLAVNSANIGTWIINTKNKLINYNSIFAKILGWEYDEILTYDKAVGQVTDEYREKIIEVLENAMLNDEDYDFVYAHKRFNDGRIIWLRATGKVTTDASGANKVFSGILWEITNDANSN